MQLQRAVEAAELAQLEAQWGIVPKQHHHLTVDDPFLSSDGQMLVSDGRRAEICYIMHQGTAADGVLLHIKTVYPEGAFRLPTGGIHQGETVMGTLAREITEETGLRVGPEVDLTTGTVQVQQLLGVVSYSMAHQTLGQTYEFATYYFLVQMAVGAVLNPLDPDERICGWQWRRVNELMDVANTLESIGEHAPDWADWGRYRAISHRFVAQALEV